MLVIVYARHDAPNASDVHRYQKGKEKKATAMNCAAVADDVL